MSRGSFTGAVRFASDQMSSDHSQSFDIVNNIHSACCSYDYSVFLLFDQLKKEGMLAKKSGGKESLFPLKQLNLFL